MTLDNDVWLPDNPQGARENERGKREREKGKKRVMRDVSPQGLDGIQPVKGGVWSVVSSV